MKRIFACLLAAGGLFAVWAQTPASAPAPQAELTQPALSPDGGQIAFASGGALWTVAAGGGPARLLISSAATDSRPLYSPDGKWLAFESTGNGTSNIYLFNLATSQLRRLTWDDGSDALDSWSPDSQWIYFSSSRKNISGMNDIYRVRATGGTPLQVSAERYVSEYDAAAAPDGSLALVSLGEMGLSQWWRNGHAHIDNTEIWRVTPATIVSGKVGYERLLPTGGAKNLWPMWSANGRALYFMSDRSGAENLWELPAPGAPVRALTHFTDGRLLWPSIAADGSAVVFERDFGIWKYDLKHNRATAVSITLAGAPALPTLTQDTITQANGFAVSPDGKKLAFTAHGEVFATGAKNGGPALRLTRTGKLQFDLVWAPDSRQLAYVSDRSGSDHIYQYDFSTGKEEQLTHGSSEDNHITYSPDGKTIAFTRGVTQIATLNLASGQESTLATGYFTSLPPLDNSGILAWSPDSKYLAFLDNTDGSFPEAYIVPASGGKPRQVSFLANSFNGSLAWSPNGKFLLFSTDQRTQPSQIARVDLVPQLPIYREDLFNDLFHKPTKEPIGHDPAATPEVDYTGIAERVQLLPMTNARSPLISPDGKWLAYVGSEGTSNNIYLVSLDRRQQLEAPSEPGQRLQAPKQLTSTTGRKSDLQFTADSKDIYFLDGGRIQRVPVAGGAAHTVNVSATLEVNFNREKEEIFEQAWRYLRDDYQNPKMNGVDWDAVRTRFAPVVAAARTPGDLYWTLSEMIGALNSSHSGIRAPSRHQTITGQLGLFFDRVTYETQGKFCASAVVPLGPAAMAGVAPGDCLEQIDGHSLTAATNLDELLNGTIGHKLTLSLTSAGRPKSVSLQPINTRADDQLIYNAWVAHNRELVSRLSGGRLGYVHMADMETGSLNKLFMDLNSTEFGLAGVVVDVRNNNGGFVNAYALDMLTRQPYLTMIPRGFPRKPARIALGQRALEKPTVLLVNQNTLSDGEDFTEGYEAMHLGQVVGVPTAGWIIYTSAGTLIDGGTVRLPSSTVLDANGQGMEMHPRPVTVEVHNPLGSWQDGKDPQLAAAVKSLLAQLNGKQHSIATGRN